MTAGTAIRRGYRTDVITNADDFIRQILAVAGVLACLATVFGYALPAAARGRATGAAGLNGPVIQLSVALSDYLDTTAPWSKYQANSQNSGLGHGEGANGFDKWQFQTGNSIHSSASVGSDGTIYIGSDDDAVYAINPDGTCKWYSLTGGTVISSPLVGKNAIFVGSDDGYVYALNKFTGHRIWSYLAGHEPYGGSGVESSPAMGPNGALYINTLNGLIALNSSTGHLTWRVNLGYVDSSPAVDPISGTIYETSQNFVYAINPHGLIEWYFNYCDTGSFPVPSPALGSNGMIYVESLGYGTSGPYGSAAPSIIALKDNLNNTYTLEWVRTGLPLGPDNEFNGAPAVANGDVYVGADNGNVYAFSAGSGVTEWVFHAGSPILGSPSVALDGTVYTLSDLGILYALNGTSGKENWEVPLGDYASEGFTRRDSSPSIGGDGTVYVGWHDGQLHAIGKDTPVSVIAPSSVVGGKTITGMVNLAGPAGPVPNGGNAGGNTVTITSNDVGVLTVPGALHISSGEQSGSFSIVTKPVSKAIAITVAASLGGVTKSVLVNVEPAPLASFVLNKTSVTGGSSVLATVTLQGVAGPGNDTVTLSSSNPNVQIPPSVTIPSTYSSAMVSITTSSVSVKTTATLTASFGGVTKTASLTVNP